MNRRGFLGLVALLAVLAAVAALVSVTDRPPPPADGPFLPGFRASLNDITKLVVTGPGNRVIATLERGAERWTVTDHQGYPADTARIRRTLLALADARLVEQKTANPDLYPRLGLQDIATADAGGIQLAITGGKAPVTVLIGNAQAGSTGFTYVRRTGEAESWLVSGQFDVGKAAGDWLDRALTDIPADRIASVTIEHPGVEVLRISRAPATAPPAGAADAAAAGIVEFRVAELPAGKALSYPGIANGVAGTLADLRLEDVATREALGPAPGKPIVARFTTTDGLVVEASSWRLPEGTRVTFTASGSGKAAAEADALNSRLGGWVYTVPSYKAEQLTRRLTELLQ
ncbi:MAG: DUF4340 domain-containing protein [Gammaproteobacteria bacterium]|nr:DUF4340 domain-containing protein [Gammaproteobacteria bacterium]